MIELRNLEQKDAPYMLEWMHDHSVVEHLQADFESKTLEDCERFIASASQMDQHIHLAIVDNEDEYMGTVSLKDIDRTESAAEFAISTRTCAMGKGYALEAMKKIIQMGHEKYDIDCIYWCVDPVNQRAVRFYDKNGYVRVEAKELPINEHYSEEQVKKYLWYKA